MISYTDSLKGLYKSDKIRIVAICPGFVDTPLIKIPEEQIKASLGLSYLKPEVVAEAFVDLAVDADKKGGGAVLAITHEHGKKYVQAKMAYKNLAKL